MTIPLFFSQDFGYAIVPLTIFIFYVLVSIEMIAEEIEDPFNGDSNDLPMHDIAQNIRRNIKEIFNK
jgi:putative membrane protein